MSILTSKESLPIFLVLFLYYLSNFIESRRCFEALHSLSTFLRGCGYYLYIMKARSVKTQVGDALSILS